MTGRQGRWVSLGLAGVGVAAGLWAGSPAVVVIAGLAVVGVGHWRRSSARRRCRRQAAEQLVAHLEAVIHRVGSGATLASAVQRAPAGVALEPHLAPLRAGLRAGMGLDRALGFQRSGAGPPDQPPDLGVYLDTVAVLVARGGPALPSLERVNETIRSGRAVEAELDVQAGQATASAFLLAALPALFVVGLGALDRRLLVFYLVEPLGAACLAVAAALSYLGWWWMAGVIGAQRSAPGDPPGRSPPKTGRGIGEPADLVGGAVAVMAALVGWWPMSAVALVVVLVRRPLIRRRRSRRRTDQLIAALPGSIDRCIAVLGAGGTVRDCVEALADRGPEPVVVAARMAMARADRGAGLAGGLRWLQGELGDVYQPLIGVLIVARDQGGAIDGVLTRLAVEAAASRRRAGELRARRLPVALLVPLVVCSLPAVLIGTVVPLAIVALRHLSI